MEKEDTCDVLALAWVEIQIRGSPTWTVVATCAFLAALCFVGSELTANYSQVDKLWSLAPCIYCLQVVCDDRTRLMAAVSAVWSIRLTHNFHRRGGYAWPPWRGDEDYRWAVLRSGELLPALANPRVFRLFNLAFISIFQHVLLLLIASPAVVAHIVATRCGPIRLQRLDWITTALILILIAIETVADRQQYNFQTEKYRLQKENKKKLSGDLKDGFCQSGLFAVVRKPNYAAEQAIWMAFHLYSVAATKKRANASDAGWVLLVLLFQGSSWFTENMSRKKYPAYAEYQKRVPLYVPGLFIFRKSKYV